MPACALAQAAHQARPVAKPRCKPLTPARAQVTGESGAGKSVLVQALGAVLGAPAVDGSVRPPADFASVEGVLQLSSSAQVRHTPTAE